MPYEAEAAQLARCATRHHGQLKEVLFLALNKECLLVFADGTVLGPADDESLEREYGRYEGYAEIAQQLGGTHPYSLLAFGYQGTGPQCFATFLQTAGFKNVDVAALESIEPPLRLHADGSRVRGTKRQGAVEWEDRSGTPALTLGVSRAATTSSAAAAHLPARPAPAPHPAHPAPPAASTRHMSDKQPMHIEFQGTGLQYLGYWLLNSLLTVTVLGTPWGLSLIYKWFVQNLSTSDGTRARWTGKGTDILLPFIGFVVAAGVLGAVIGSQSGQRNPNPLLTLLAALLLLGIVSWFYLTILRWFFGSVGLDSGQPLAFRGSFLGYLGWLVLSVFSIYTVIGWAWVGTAFMRWVCRNLEVSSGAQVRFVGSGFELLGRGIVFVLGSIFVITIPWMVVWLIRWVVRQVEVEPAIVPSGVQSA